MGKNKSKNNFINNITNSLKTSKIFKVICAVFILFLISFASYKIYLSLDSNLSILYKVNNEKVTINIDETNKALVKEVYNVTFTNDNECFQVIIPLTSSHQFKTKIKGITVKDFNKKIIRDKEKVILLIYVNKTESEVQSESYTRNIEVTYVVDRGDDFDTEIDYINYYLASPYRPYKISQFEYKIIMPKNTKSTIDNTYSLFNKKALSGETQTLNKSEIKASLSDKGNVIQGKLLTSLNAYEGIEFNHEVYENYFENERNILKDENKLILLYIIFFFICFINFFLCGRDCTMLYLVTEEIPKNISPLLSALLLANNEDDEIKINDFESRHLSSLLIKWANQGLIHIERFKVPLSLANQIEDAEKELNELERLNAINHNENEEKKKESFSLFKKEHEEAKKDYTIEYRFTKLKEPMLSDIPYYEKYIFDGIFVMQVNDVVDTQIIKANFGAFRECILYLKAQIANAKKELFNYLMKVKSQCKDPIALKKKNELKLMSYMCFFVAIIFETLIHYTCIDDLLSPTIFIFGLAILDFVILQDNDKVNIITSLLFFTLGYFILKINPWSYLLLTLSNLLIVIIRKYTFQYELIIEKIKSLRKFLKRKSRVGIVNALNENSKYFYEVMPHAISLDKYNDLVKMCEEFKIAMPGWLLMHPNDFSISLFREIIPEIDETWNYIIDNTI